MNRVYTRIEDGENETYGNVIVSAIRRKCNGRYEARVDPAYIFHPHETIVTDWLVFPWFKFKKNEFHNKDLPKLKRGETAVWNETKWSWE